MPLKIFTMLALWLAMTFHAQAATAIEDPLVRAAFFSDACRQQAEALGIARTSDAKALFAALAGVGRHRTTASGADAQRDDCRTPVVVLINLLRLNGIDAELVFAAMANPAETAPSGQIDRVLVYVPTLDRYFDPAVPLEEQMVVDLLVRERAGRTHFLGPSLAGTARDACRDTCMHVYTPRNGMPPVRVKTEVIRGQ